MPRMPGAIWRPLASNWADMPRIKQWDIFCIHTMVGGLVGTDEYFRVINGPGFVGTESHFGVGYDGTIYQWQDTDYQADANWRGGYRVISSENADTGPGFPKWSGSDVPALTDAQVEANAEIAAWLHDEHGMPPDLIHDSKPGRRGIGWHRLGVPARKDDAVSQTGGELWSKSAGKVCPGDRRVAQIPLISARAKQLLAGDLKPEQPQEDDDMPRFDLIRNSETGQMVLAAPGIWRVLANTDYVKIAAADGRVKSTTPDLDVPGNRFRFWQSVYLDSEINDAEILEAVKALGDPAP